MSGYAGASHPVRTLTSPGGYGGYLAAKVTVDDRALNPGVLDTVRGLIPEAPRVLEVGGGLGTMVPRLYDRDVVRTGEYTLVDADRALLRDARGWLGAWASARGLRAEPEPDGLRVGDLRVRLVEAELGAYLDAGLADPADLLIAAAFLDLVDVPAVLPGLLRLLAPGGAYWFPLNFDGDTIFEPGHPGDAEVLGAYHRDMDERVRYGRPAGDSRTGRHLFHHLRAAGAPPLAAGSSDWVVHAGPDGTYPADEAVFLDAILTTIEGALTGGADPAGLTEWLNARRDQLATGDLVYVAHQLDFAGKPPA